MINIHRFLGFFIRKIDSVSRPFRFSRQKSAVLKKHPQLAPLMKIYQSKYIKVEYGAHDISLMERIQRDIAREDTYIYGSTPWTVFMKIMAEVDIKPDDVFIELGCGTGHLCFFMNMVHHIKSVGIEAIASFIHTAKEMKMELEGLEQINLKNLYFYNLDFLTFDCSNGTIFYMAGTCFPESFRKKIIKRLEIAPVGARIITLTHQIDHPQFNQIKQTEAYFSWGRDKVFIYQKVA